MAQYYLPILLILILSSVSWWSQSNGFPLHHNNYQQKKEETTTVISNPPQSTSTNNQGGGGQPTITYDEIILLLAKTPFSFIKKSIENSRMKRNTDAGNVDIHALQTTINDHRTMINYLINNSINATFVADAISGYHTRTGPILSSWRDLVDIFCIILFLGVIIYLLMCRTGCTLCDRVLQFIFKPLVQRVQQQQEQQIQEQPIATIEMVRKASSRRNQQQSYPTTATSYINQYNNGDILD